MKTFLCKFCRSLGSSGDEIDDVVPNLPSHQVPNFVSIFDSSNPGVVQNKPKELFRPHSRFPVRNNLTDSEVATDVISGK